MQHLFFFLFFFLRFFLLLRAVSAFASTGNNAHYKNRGKKSTTEQKDVNPMVGFYWFLTDSDSCVLVNNTPPLWLRAVNTTINVKYITARLTADDSDFKRGLRARFFSWDVCENAPTQHAVQFQSERRYKPKIDRDRSFTTLIWHSKQTVENK